MPAARGAPGPVPRGLRLLDAVAVTDLDAEMRGVGRSSSSPELSVLVPGVLPGELASVRVDHVDRAARAYATLVSVSSAAPARVPSPCARFLDCSGCDLLHASPDFALEAKRARVARALGGVAVDAVVPSPRALGYRALAKLVVGPGGVLGSYRARSHDVAEMQGCVVHAPEVERVVEAIRACSLSALRYVLVRASISEGRALVVLVGRSASSGAEARAVASALAPREDVAAVYFHENDSSGDELLARAPFTPIFDRGPIYEAIGALRYKLEPGAFAQVNPLAAAELYARAVALAAPDGARVLDLYSGSGGLALALARAGAASVTAVESVGPAVQAGIASAALNAVSSVRFVHARAEDAPLEDFEVVMLNPPRKGAAPAVLARVASLRDPAGRSRFGPERIVYVSCNPDTLARDVALLEAYALAKVVPVDLFPGTRHVETIALLQRLR